MAEEGKKISFGFFKSTKKAPLKNAPAPEQKKVEYIECLDDKSIKIIGGEEKKDEPLVIPMLGSKTWHDRILNKVDADIFEHKTTELNIKNESTENIEIKKEPSDGLPNGNVCSENKQPIDIVEIKKEPQDIKPLTLEEQAAQEIISDLNSKDTDKTKEIFTVPVPVDDDLRGKEEPTLDDYENIPIDAFGEAMLRGMGWQPGKGIGKNARVIPPAIPELRPKGMGLGADKITIQKALGKINNKQNEQTQQQLKLVKGSYVKVTEGKHSNTYATVEGFDDDDSARVIIKLALGGEVISVYEYWLQPVTSSEYEEKSKILNIKKYEEFKEKEKNKKERSKKESSHSAEDSDDENQKNKRSEKSKKKSKKKRHQSSEDESSPERKPRKRRSSSSSDEDQKYKKPKKSKKHKSRDSSSERSSRKNRKKDKEREKSRYKKSDYSDSSEQARCRRRKKSRSRSRSHSPKNRRKGRSRSRSPRR